jgi:hypothetical protein
MEDYGRDMTALVQALHEAIGLANPRPIEWTTTPSEQSAWKIMLINPSGWCRTPLSIMAQVLSWHAPKQWLWQTFANMPRVPSFVARWGLRQLNGGDTSLHAFIELLDMHWPTDVPPPVPTGVVIDTQYNALDTWWRLEHLRVHWWSPGEADEERMLHARVQDMLTLGLVV